ncbi:hypothetical protein MAR_036936 [Mya arenaria]|uniref:LRAT domain-containing protein n=1 Tax=Mya arenaria TaxID=6604 RepID=A0ABY7FNU0_MYAAR|nr:hypothetical protein MAR_036936 [Mya arenaria]
MNWPPLKDLRRYEIIQNQSLSQYLDDEALMGVNCTSCEQEWLREEYLNQSGGERNIFNGKSLTEQKNPLEKEQEQFQVKGSRTRIEADNFYILKPGDHISWHRPYIIWHHAIVIEIDIENKRIHIISYNMVKYTTNTFLVVVQWTSFEKEWGTLYRIDYPKKVTDKNPPKLTLSRAWSKIGETKYGFFSNNCESYATFCKTGVSDSCQVRWLWGKIKETCGIAVSQQAKGVSKAVCCGMKEASSITVEQTLQCAGKLAVVETVGQVRGASNWMGTGIVIAIEYFYLVRGLIRIYQNRKNGDLSRKDFLESAIQRVAEANGAAGFAVGGSFTGEALGGVAGAVIGTAFMPVSAAIGVVIGSLIGGTLGAIGGKLVGSLMGPYIAKTFVAVIKRDDRAVKSITDLEQGDQVVFYGWLLHPRHHAIVVDIDPSQNKVRVIHNTYEHGVIEEWVDFKTPLYKVIYESDSSREPESVVESARSKLGNNNYNIAIYNCKDFANWCKEV